MKKKTSKKSPKEYKLKKELKSIPHFKTSEDRVNFWLNCLVIGEVKMFQDVLVQYLNSVNKEEFAEKSGLGRRTVYDLANPKKPFSPRLKTIGAICKAMTLVRE